MGVAPIVAPTIGARSCWSPTGASSSGSRRFVWRGLRGSRPSGSAGDLARRTAVRPDQHSRSSVTAKDPACEPVFFTRLMGGAGSLHVRLPLRRLPVFIKASVSPSEFALLFGLCSSRAGRWIADQRPPAENLWLHTMLRAICRFLTATATLLFSLAGVQTLWMIGTPLFVVLSWGFSSGNTAVGALSRHAPHAASAAAPSGSSSTCWVRSAAAWSAC